MQEEKQNRFSLQNVPRPLILGAGVLIVLFVLSVLFLLPKSPGQSGNAVALHFSDAWKDVGAIDGCLFFREGSHLTAFDRSGKRWEANLSSQSKIAYGEKLYVLEATGKLRVVNPQNGHVERTVSLPGVRGLIAVEAQAFSPAALMGVKADRFLLLNADGAVESVQKTTGTPGLYVPSKNGAAWTEEGNDEAFTAEGTIPMDPALSPLLTGSEDPVRGVLKKKEEQSALFQCAGPEPFTRLLWTGENSIVAAQGNRLFFICDNTIKHVIDCTNTWDVVVMDKNIWVMDGRTLTSYSAEGEKQKSETLDFDAQRLISSGSSLVILGKNRRLRIDGERKTVEDTQEFVRALPQADGSHLVIYRESFLVMPR